MLGSGASGNSSAVPEMMETQPQRPTSTTVNRLGPVLRNRNRKGNFQRRILHHYCRRHTHYSPTDIRRCDSPTASNSLLVVLYKREEIPLHWLYTLCTGTWKSNRITVIECIGAETLGINKALSSQIILSAEETRLNTKRLYQTDKHLENQQRQRLAVAYANATIFSYQRLLNSISTLGSGTA